MAVRSAMFRITLGVLLLALVAGCATQAPADGRAPREVPAASADADQQIVVTIRDAQSMFRSAPGSTARVYGSAPSYRGTPYAQRVITGLTREYHLDWVADWRIDVLDIHCAVFRVRNAVQRDSVVTRMMRDSRVESVQRMHTFQTQSRTGEYNDPYFRLQKGVETMRIPQAHQWSRGRGVSVAIIDTGVDSSHPELAGRVRTSRNFVDDDTQRFRADRHGTAVAGVIAALTDNRTGIVGVAPASQLLALKACWYEAVETPAVCSTLTLAEAIAYAIQQRVHVINLSLGGPGDPLLTRLLSEAMKRGIIVIGASGSAVRASQGFPLNVPGVIAVADADEPGAKPGASDGVASGDPTAATLLAAPGHEVLTLVPGQRYDYVSGSSISAALVSGVVALLLEGRRLSSTAILDLLDRTARVPEERPLRVVDACDAVASVVHAPACATPESTHNLAVVPTSARGISNP
jgi:hypothetical protein